MHKQQLTQTNPYIVTNKAYQSGPLGYSSSTGTQFYEVKENDPRHKSKFKTAMPEDYENSTSKKAKVIKKIEYSGGYRVPKESLDKPYMKNKCWKSNDDEDDNAKYSKEQILKKLGLEVPIEIKKDSKKRKGSRTRSRSAGEKADKQRQNIMNMSSQLLVSQAEKKINDIHSRREEMNSRRLREEEMKKKAQKLILQNEDTHEEVYVTVDTHKIRMIQSYVKQLELQEQLENLQRLKSEKLYTRSASKFKKALTLEQKMKKEFTQKEIENELRYVELIKNHEVYKVEKEQIGKIEQVYYALSKKDFDLNEFLSPNQVRWDKKNTVSIQKNEINPFSHLLFSREAYILLVDRIVVELESIQKKSEMFNSLNQSKDRKVEAIDSIIVEQFFTQRQDVRNILNIQLDQIPKEFNLKNETIPLNDIKNILVRIANVQINIRSQIIGSIEQQYEEKMNILRSEYEAQEKIKQLDQELEQVRQENEEQGIVNLKQEEIDNILDMEEHGNLGGYDSDPEALTLQQQTILISKQKRDLQKEILLRREARCKSAEGVRLTVPDPYQFEERARISKMKKSIREKKLEEMIQEQKDKQKSIYGYVFKPKEIPENVLITDLFDQIMEENEKRRDIVRQTSKQMTLENERPFSFYYRDMDKEKIYKRPYWEREKYVFRANAVPKHVTQKRLEKIKKLQEQKRKARVQKRKEELERISSLPPRMAKHEEDKKAKLLMEADEFDEEGNPILKPQVNNQFFNYSFEPPRAKKIDRNNKLFVQIPDFGKMHKTFQTKLDAKKSSFQPTKIEPFDFQESRKLPNRDYLDQENMLIKATLDKFYEDKSIQIKKITQTEPDILPPSTKKSQEIIAYRKKQDEIKRKKEKEKQDEQIAREKKREELKKRFYSSSALKNFKEEREQQKHEKEIEKQEEREYQKQLNQEFHNQIKQKLDSKPLLIEKYDKDHSVIQKAVEKWSFKTGSTQNKYSQHV